MIDPTVQRRQDARSKVSLYRAQYRLETITPDPTDISLKVAVVRIEGV